jgi:hypothetical protein
VLLLVRFRANGLESPIEYAFLMSVVSVDLNVVDNFLKPKANNGISPSPVATSQMDD